eukprot:6006657-Amphidinium_carterae.1
MSPQPNPSKFWSGLLATCLVLFLGHTEACHAIDCVGVSRVVCQGNMCVPQRNATVESTTDAT